ncbi:CBS domain-containing protein [Candidatus Bathyarchaeota archaeon]|nr:CBS domain-containing protein [Candidatus Bathyarchaeota archaeon]
MKGSVKDYMVKEIATVDAEADVSATAEKMAQTPRCYLIVLRNGQPLGIVTEKDLVNKVLAKRLDPSKIKVQEIMSSPLITVDPDAQLTTAAELMKEKNVRKLPVAKDGILYGMITARDIADEFADYVDKSMRDMLRYIPF